MIWYVGDIHGGLSHVVDIDRAAIEAGVRTVVQVGDFGILWPGTGMPIRRYFEKRDRQGRPGPRWITCGGNHENWKRWFELQREQGDPTLVELAPGCFFAQRGSVHTIDEKKHLFLGGAESIDKHMRVENTTWWSDETPSYQEFSDFFQLLDEESPEVVVTHDAPLRVPLQKRDRDVYPTPRSLESAISMSTHKPARWYFGHHHVDKEWLIDGVKYICCGLHGDFKEG